jgi:anti-anti-sigma factor
MLGEFFKINKKTLPLFIDGFENYDRLHIVRLKGPIDISTVPDIEHLLLRVKKKSDLLDKNILVDFKNVTHVDSATVAMLIDALSKLKHHQHKLVLVNLTPELKVKLDILKLDKLFMVCKCEGNAYAKLIEDLTR